MIKAECDNCGKNGEDDYIYCRKCYEALEEKINTLGDELYYVNDEKITLQEEIDRANARIEDLKEEIQKLSNMLDIETEPTSKLEE